MFCKVKDLDSYSNRHSKPLAKTQVTTNEIPSNEIPKALEAYFLNKEGSSLKADANRSTFSFKIEEDLAGKSLDYLHLRFRGRLRMGELSSPFKVAASTLVPFQLPEWISKYYQEILWHLIDAHFKNKNVSPWSG
ncbi:MAG: hypothetical protein WCI18_08340 [Pseudomonadota bacterium]